MVLPAWHDDEAATAVPTIGTGPELPFCETCRSDQYLIIEEFVPPRLQPGTGLTSAEASYSCLKCGQFSGHDVPSDWEPPGWFWYA
jgi:hypothetical protein